MLDLSTAPDLADLTIPMDAWTEPFWMGTARHELLMLRCGDCGRFRWPPGPFCPACQSQAVEWVEAGQGRIYSFTVVDGAKPGPDGEACIHIPGLIEFPAAGSVRLLAAIVAADPVRLHIGASVHVDWMRAANATVPVFTMDARPVEAPH